MLTSLALSLLALLLGGCLEFESKQCANGIVCPPGTLCSPVGTCSAVFIGCGNGVQDDDEECDDGNRGSGDGCGESCRLEVCGNGAIDVAQTEEGLVQAEECDDGNPLSLDGCSAICELTAGTWEGYGDPPLRNGRSGAAYDIGRRRAVLFDGSRTWEWDGAGWFDATPPNAADSPGPMPTYDLAYDSARARVLLVGGDNAGPVPNDTWEWDGVSWKNVTPDRGETPGRPGASFAMAYDTARNVMVLRRNETLWEWDGQGWNQYTTFGSPQGEGAMTYDPTRGQILLVVGGLAGAELWAWDGARWSLLNAIEGEDRPFLIDRPALAYDPVRDRLVLREPYDEGIGRTWEWDGADWSSSAPAAGEDSPPEAAGSQFFYDLNEERMLLVVGQVDGEDIGEAVGATGGTWAWDGARWTDVTPGERDLTPRAALASAMTFDESRGETLLFGGLEQIGEQANSNQTWAWDGAQWSDVSPTGSAASPPPRSHHAMAYDSARGLVVLFGGLDDMNQALTDTWEWDGSSWANVTPTQPGSIPPSEGDAAMYYDSARERIVVAVRVGFPETLELWEWDGSVWSELVPQQGGVPPSREKFSLTYDPVRQRAVLFGGNNFGSSSGSSGNLQDTWEWDGSSWTELSPPNSPSARGYHRMAYDAQSQRVLLFGGARFNASAGALVEEVSEELWAWDGSNWTQLEPSAAVPGARGAHAMAYDSSRARLVVFGGASHHFLGDTWEFDGTGWQDRTSRPPDRPLPREFATMNYDAALGGILLFGGFATDGFSNELWERNGRGWRRLGPAADETAPSPRMGAASCFDRARQRLVVFGGSSEAFGPGLSDTWEWDGETWQVSGPASPTLAPPPRVFASMTFDATRGTCILFGGQSGASSSVAGEDATYYSDTWEWNGSSWTNISPTSGPAPRSRHRLAYDGARLRVVLFGGSSPSNLELGDTWEWDGSEWVEVTPQQIEESPPAMMDLAMTYDTNLRKIVLLGGHGGPLSDSRIPEQGDVWVWNGVRWTMTAEASATTPPARLGHTMAYDSALGRSIVFGGNYILPGGPPYDDTWLYSQKALGPEQCHSGMDPDRDGLIGCADPDCWGSCTPLCLPFTTPDWPADCDTSSNACGDGECNQNLESPRLCPADCGAPTAICGDTLCDSGENVTTCPGDCSQ